MTGSYRDAMLFILFSCCIYKRKLKGLLLFFLFFFFQPIQGLEIHEVQEYCQNIMHSGLWFSVFNSFGLGLHLDHNSRKQVEITLEVKIQIWESSGFSFLLQLSLISSLTHSGMLFVMYIAASPIFHPSY